MGKKPLTPEQRERHRAAVNRWADKHKEERRTYGKKWRAENREKSHTYAASPRFAGGWGVVPLGRWMVPSPQFPPSNVASGDTGGDQNKMLLLTY
jgi:hypothetical protein